MTAAPRLVVIVGPTGAGKTATAVALARAVDGEIVSCDSQQVYRGMDLGTGKADAAARAAAVHHLLDVVAPDAEMTAARFTALAEAAIADIAARCSTGCSRGRRRCRRCAPSSTRWPPPRAPPRCGRGWPRSIRPAPRGSIATIASG